MIIEQSKQIISEINHAFIGKNEVIEKVLMTIYAGGHVLLEDCPGVGKTTLAVAFSRVLGLSTRRIQFTPDTLPSDITGFTMWNRKTGEFEYREGAANCQLLLADEINRTSPKTQSALLEVMEERTITVDGETHALPAPFICIATQNPFGFAGTQALPESRDAQSNSSCMQTHFLFQYGEIRNESKDVAVYHGSFGHQRNAECLHPCAVR